MWINRKFRLKRSLCTSKEFIGVEFSMMGVNKYNFSYLHKKHEERKNNQIDDDDDDNSDANSVASDEFEEMLNNMNGKKRNLDDEELDFMNEIGESLKNQAKGVDYTLKISFNKIVTTL